MRPDNRSESAAIRDVVESIKRAHPHGHPFPSAQWNAATPFVGQRVTCNGYPGTITVVCTGQLHGMVEVRLSSGTVCVDYAEMLRASVGG